MKRKLLVVLAIVAVLCSTVPASADIFQVLNITQSTTLGPAPYAFLDISLSGTTATVLFSTVAVPLSTNLGGTTFGTAQTAAFSPGDTYFFGTVNEFDLNVTPSTLPNTTDLTSANFSNFHAFNGTTFTPVSGITWTETFNSNGAVNGFGKLNVRVNGNQFSTQVQTVWFQITDFPGLTPDADGFDAAAHIGNDATPQQVTAFAAVPIPPSALLLGSGLLGLVGFGWRRRQG